MHKYQSLDGLRAYSAIGIVMMHVLANIVKKPDDNYLTTTLIPYFTNFTLLFMIISSFSVCCGYYDRVKNGEIRPNEFYSKRYRRLLPFFALMVIISVILDFGYSAMCGGFADLTLCFNLLPNPDIKIVGVGWFIGTVFTFYLLFPFFTFLLDNKKRGFFVMLVSLIFCYIAINYFSSPEFVVKKIDRVNIIYSAPFFISGGLIYLYKDKIYDFVTNHYWLMLVFCIIVTILKFTCLKVVDLFIIPDLVLFSVWLMYAIGSKDKVLNNKFVSYISKISLEIYLCHMMFYRVVERLHFENTIADRNILYIITFVVTLAGAIVFSHIIKFVVFPKTIDKLCH